MMVRMPFDFIRRKAAGAVSVQGLLLKAGMFGLGWWALPIWIFVPVALYLYFVPPFQPLRLALPFALTLAAALMVPANPWFAALLAGIFFLVLGIKNLIFINRFASHQLLVFLVLFLVFANFFSRFENWQSWAVPIWASGLAVLFFFLTQELFKYESVRGRRERFALAGIGGLFVFQLSAALLVMPLNYFSQTAFLFLASVILLDLLLGYSSDHLDRRKILADFSIFFVLAVVLLASARWGL